MKLTSKEGVRTALDYRAPDRVPRFESFSSFAISREFVDIWGEKGLGPQSSIEDYYKIDIRIAIGDEGLMPTRADTPTYAP